MLRVIEEYRLCRCTAICDRLHDLIVSVSCTGSLRKVRDAEYLDRLRQAGDFSGDLEPHLTADADIDLIKDQCLLREQVRDHHLDGERIKLTVAILDRDLRADAVRVSGARQVSQNGTWVDAPMAAATVQRVFFQ